MVTPLYVEGHNSKNSTILSLLSLKPPSEETKNTTITPPNSKHMAMPRAPNTAALLLSYLSPFHFSSSIKENSNRERKNTRLPDVNGPMVMMSPQVGCMGQIKTRHKKCPLAMRKGNKKSEKNILIHCLVSLSEGNSRVRDVPKPVKTPVISITEMDPPLPVKKIKQEDLNKVSLWERRFGGKELEKLQLTEKHRQLTTVSDICPFG